FQEQATLFFLLGALLAFLQSPGGPTACLASAAILIQVASLNYWSVYDSWFIAIVLASYVVCNRAEVRHATAKLLDAVRQRRAASAGLLAVCAVTASLWLVLLRSIEREQAGNYVRTSNGGETYGIQVAFDRIQEVRQFTLGLFDPVIAVAGSPHFI